MADYVIFFPADDEAAWSAATEAERQVAYDTDGEFVGRLKAIGGTVLGGAEVAPSSETRTITRGADGEPVVTPGPRTSSAEQLSGFLIVSCDDYDGLVEAAKGLAVAHPVVEIKPTVES